MPSRPTVVLVSLLLATPAVILWLWLVILLASIVIKCPGECRCEFDGYYVNCSGSALNSIPLNLPTHVRILELHGNGIMCFENDSFVSKGLVDLHILKADLCNIRKIELGAFNGLTKLTKLSMEGNEISEIIPGTFEKISRLEYLDLNYNTIEHLEVDVFSGLLNLKYIDMKGNQLQYLHPETFIRLPKLQTLDLSNNPGLQIPTDRHFINSHSLKYLVISHCNVSSVSVETFANISALEWLDMSYNKLRSLDISILKVLPKLSTLYMDANPLQCDCQLQEVWRWCQDQNIQCIKEWHLNVTHRAK
jgi:Leucine-rich repeat (LRR) protein